MSKNNEAITGTGFVFSTLSMPPTWMFDAPEPGADCSFAVEEKDLPERSDVDTSHYRQGGSQRGSNDRLAFEEVSSRDDLNDPSLERYFRGRNAPYYLNDPGNLLKLLKNGAPSEPFQFVRQLKLLAEIDRTDAPRQPRDRPLRSDAEFQQSR
jgi:hypothetical protein